MLNFPRIRLTIADMLLITLGVAIVIPGWHRLVTDVGSFIWVGLTAAIICCCIKQIVRLMLGVDLPFDKSELSLRIRWIAIRTIGVVGLTYFLIDPFSKFPYDFFRESEVYSEAHSQQILEHCHSLIVFVGILFSIAPLARIGSDHWVMSPRWYYLLPGLLFAFLFLVTGIYDSQLIQGLVAIAVSGIDAGQDPRLFTPHLDLNEVPNFAKNWKEFYLISGDGFLAALLCLITSILQLFIRNRIAKACCFIIAVASLGYTIFQLEWIYSVGLPGLSYSWQFATSLPGSLGVVAFICTSLVFSFVIVRIAPVATPKRAVEIQPKQYLRFELPALILWLILAGIITELLLLNIGGFAFGRTSARFASSNYSLIPYASMELPMSFGWLTGMSFIFITVIWISNALIVRYWITRDPQARFCNYTRPVTTTVFQTLFLTFTLPIVALAFSNFGLSIVLTDHLHVIPELLIRLESTAEDSNWWYFVFLAYSLIAILAVAAYRSNRNSDRLDKK